MRVRNRAVGAWAVLLIAVTAGSFASFWGQASDHAVPRDVRIGGLGGDHGIGSIPILGRVPGEASLANPPNLIVPVGNPPSQAAYDPVKKEIFVANEDSSNACAIGRGLVATLMPQRSTTQVGAQVTLTLEFSGGTAPITWTLTENGSASNLTGASGGTYRLTPLQAGTYTFYLNATDAVGNISKATATVVVKAMVASLSSSPSTTQVGEASTLSYSFTAGVVPITWTLTKNGSASNLTGASGGTYTFTPLHAGTYTFYLNATDTVGSVSRVTTTVVVKAALVASLSASPNMTRVGGSSTLTYSLTGGVTPITWTLEVNHSASNLTAATGGHYTFIPAYAGAFKFWLNATDAVGSHSIGAVTVVVEAALTASLSSSPSTTRVGVSSTLSYSFTGGVAPITWTLTENGSASNLTGASGGTYPFTPLHTGTYTFYLNATDAVGNVSKVATTVVVIAAMVVSLSASPNTTQAGESAVLSYSFTAGEAPIAWTLTKNGSTSNLTGASGGTYTFTPLHAGTYTFYLNATDAAGNVSKVTTTVVVKAALVASLSANPSTTQVGESSILTYSFTGGVTPITWTLEPIGSFTNLTGASGGHYTFIPVYAGTYTFRLNATDAVGSFDWANATVVVKGALVASLSASPSTTRVGETSTLSFSFTAGVAPITWTLTKNGSGSNLTGASGGTCAFTPLHAGTYTFYLNATDAVGSSSDYTALVTAEPGQVAMYSVKFVETGLPSGTLWQVSLNSSTMNSTSPAITFTEPNGTDSYTIGVVSGYAPVLSSGSVKVSGSTLVISVQFLKARLTLTFQETGLTPGTVWCVTVGHETCSSGALITFRKVAPGTYPLFIIHPVSGYTDRVTLRGGGIAGNGTVFLNLNVKFIRDQPPTIAAMLFATRSDFVVNF